MKQQMLEGGLDNAHLQRIKQLDITDQKQYMLNGLYNIRYLIQGANITYLDLKFGNVQPRRQNNVRIRK